MQANGSRPRGLTVLVPFCVGIWGSVGQSHPPVPCQMLARTSGGAAAPKSKGKGTGGGASTPKRAGEETPPAAARARWGRRGGRLPVRPSLQEPNGEGEFQGGFLFFFFFGVFLLIL